MTESLIPKFQSHEMPLCLRYSNVCFDSQLVEVIGDGVTRRELTVIWALGALRDCNWEVMGAWASPAAGTAFWRGVFDEFSIRGVEAPISVVLAEAVVDLRAVLPGTTVLLSFGRLLSRTHAPHTARTGAHHVLARRAIREASSVRAARVALEILVSKLGAGMLSADWSDLLPQLDAFYALRPARRNAVRRGDEAAEQLGLMLKRAVARHGPVDDADTALSFVIETLKHAEHQLKFAELSKLCAAGLPAGPAQYALRVALSGIGAQPF